MTAAHPNPHPNPLPNKHSNVQSRSQTLQREVLEAPDVTRALTRIAHEILERTRGGADVLLLGIPTRGVGLAHRLAHLMGAVENREVLVGSLDITMYRDDLRLRPARALARTEVPGGGVDGMLVVLVDDVLFSGRTVRAALDALGELGRPRAVQLAVLVDRGHRELPIKADYVGKNLPTSLREQVTVLIEEHDGRDAVLLGPGDVESPSESPPADQEGPEGA
jgi:pyrimidine operon attenuation protein/uracil phosphoribosyltransferase